MIYTRIFRAKIAYVVLFFCAIVNSQNNAPTFTSTPAETILNEGGFFSYPVRTNDIDGNAVTVNPLTKPSWLSFTTLGDVSSISFGDESITNEIYDAVVDASGNIYVVDVKRHRIKKITPNGVITIFAGASTSGLVDGVGESARFTNPSSLVIDNIGNIYVGGSVAIRKITPDGNVTTLALTGAYFSSGFQSIAVDNGGTVYVSNATDGKIYRILGNGTVTNPYNNAINDDYLTYPSGLAFDSLGFLYIADASRNQIFKVNTAVGDKILVAGSGAYATTDGIGTLASFAQPVDIEIDALDNVYVACAGGNNIRKITPSGVVSTLAGSLVGESGNIDNNGLLARFNRPRGLALDVLGNIYVADTDNEIIRKIDANVLSGDTTGNAGNHDVILEASDGNGGTTQQSFTISVLVTPTAVANAATDIYSFGAVLNGNITANGGTVVTERGFIYSKTSDDDTPTYAEVNGGTVIKEIITGTLGSFNKNIINLIKSTEYSYIAYATNSVGTTESTIQTFTPVNVAPTFTSTPIEKITDSDTYVYNISANDKDNDGIIITAPTIPSWISLSELQNVTTYAGSGASEYQNSDGAALSSKFKYPNGVALDPFGNVYVADGRARIRKISTDGIVSTYAGAVGTGSSDTDGYRTSATFGSVFDVAIDVLGNIYIADLANNKIRKIDTNGNVSTLAGSGAAGSDDGEGASASFNYPTGVAVDGSGNVFVADSSHKIRKITPSGSVTTIAGSGIASSVDGVGVLASFHTPWDVAVDNSGNLYVTEAGKNKIRKISTDGTVTTLAGSGLSGSADGTGTAASFNFPTGITIDASGNLYVSDGSGHKIRKIDINNAVVSTIAGSGVAGDNNDVGLSATFYGPRGIAVDALGENIFVANQNNHKIKKISVSYGLTGYPINNEGEYPVVIEASDGNETSQQNFTITVNKNNTFTTTGNWSETAKWTSGVPTTDFSNITVANDVTITMDTDDITVSDLTLNSGATMNIPKDKEITINGNFNTSGSLLLGSDKNDSGVLFVKGTTSGTVTYKRGGLLANKWSIVTPPVSGQKIVSFAQNTANDIRTNATVSPIRYAIGTYDDAQATGNEWQYFTADTPVADEFIKGTAYSMSRGTEGVVSFTGTLNVESIPDKMLPTDQWSAIGNPYTTYLAANKNEGKSFLDDNFASLDDVYKSLFIWDNVQNKYIAVSQVDDNNRSLPPGQGFFVRMKNGQTNIIFNKDKRQLKPTTGTTIFNRSANSAPEIVVNISNTNATVKTNIKYFDTATRGLDPGYDIGNFDSASFDVFTHLLENGNNVNYTIQSLPKSNFEDMIIPLGIKASTGEEITFTATFVDLPNDLKVFLEDQELNVFTELDESSRYTIPINNDINGVGRFYIHTTSQVLGVDNIAALSAIKIYVKDRSNLRISGLKNGNTKLKLYSLLGKQVFNTKFEATGTKNISLPTLAKGIYLVELQTKDGVLSKKILLK